MSTSPDLSEARRQAALSSWRNTGDDPEARRRRTEAATRARLAGVGEPRRTLHERFDDLEGAVRRLAELLELREAS